MKQTYHAEKELWQKVANEYNTFRCMREILGITDNGNGYRLFKNKLEKLDIDVSHFKYGGKVKQKLTWKEVLVNDEYY